MSAAEAPPSDPARIREEWIEARVAQFNVDPEMRDRAIATILFDTLSLNESVGQAMRDLHALGPAGMIKQLIKGGGASLMGAGRNGT